MLKLLSTIAISSLVLATPVIAIEKNQHFTSVPSPDLNTAICNTQSYNEELAPLVAKKTPSVEDMVKIHELTYTLENALIQIEKDLVKMKSDLEEVHKGSESMQADKIAKFGTEYLSAVNLLLNNTKCEK